MFFLLSVLWRGTTKCDVTPATLLPRKLDCTTKSRISDTSPCYQRLAYSFQPFRVAWLQLWKSENCITSPQPWTKATQWPKFGSRIFRIRILLSSTPNILRTKLRGWLSRLFSAGGVFLCATNAVKGQEASASYKARDSQLQRWSTSIVFHKQ